MVHVTCELGRSGFMGEKYHTQWQEMNDQQALKRASEQGECEKNSYILSCNE